MKITCHSQIDAITIRTGIDFLEGSARWVERPVYETQEMKEAQASVAWRLRALIGEMVAAIEEYERTAQAPVTSPGGEVGP